MNHAIPGTISCPMPTIRQMFDNTTISFDIVRTQLKKDGLTFPKPMDLLGRS
jgi:hypothetical protein